jgi:hypothetical protein
MNKRKEDNNKISCCSIVVMWGTSKRFSKGCWKPVFQHPGISTTLEKKNFFLIYQDMDSLIEYRLTEERKANTTLWYKHHFWNASLLGQKIPKYPIVNCSSRANIGKISIPSQKP